MSDAGRTDAERVELIRQIVAEPVPGWYQNAHRRANAYAEQLQRIAEIVADDAGSDASGE